MYQEFAFIYDRLMEDFPYKDYQIRVLEFIKPEGKLLEIGCGSGRMTSFFFQAGTQVHGLDLSLPMLSLAKRRLPKVNFYQGRLEDLSLGKFNQIFACVDVLNYYTSIEELRAFFLSIKDHLCGEFFFDLRHPSDMVEELADKVFFYEEEEADLVWINEKDGELLYQDLVIYWKEDGGYRKTSEEHIQRMWSMEEVEGLLMELGFVIKKKNETKERIFYLCGLTA
ncbi:MAG: methyltransferase domain-containing protein [Tissierellia bacterium]|nr:methyltransferase domain-containing protein [Tissierellia bacterium]